MKGTTPEKFKCKQPGCEAEYNDNAHLGIHLRAKHGIAGQSATAIHNRNLRHAAKAAATQTTNPPTKRPYTKRRELATIPQEANGHVHHASNGQAQTLSRRFHSEAALAVAYGRFTELCKSVAFEYDLPPRSFAARFLELINNSETLR
jgi:hypothetical protein